MKKILVLILSLAVAISFGSCASTGSSTSAKPAAEKPAAAPAAMKALAVDNFEGQNSGGKWEAYDDVKDNKGSSKANPAPWVIATEAGKGAKGTDHYAKCWGTVTTKFQYGFGGLGYDFDPADNTKTMDMTGYKGIHFWMKGDGKGYSLSVKSPSANKDFAYYSYIVEATSPEWTEYTIDFAQFHQPSWGASTSRKVSFTAATGIQFQTIGQPIDKFEFSVDEFSFY